MPLAHSRRSATSLLYGLVVVTPLPSVKVGDTADKAAKRFRRAARAEIDRPHCRLAVDEVFAAFFSDEAAVVGRDLLRFFENLDGVAGGFHGDLRS